MNIASFLQDRQYGLVSSKSRNFKYKQLDQFLDEKITESFVNKPCSVSGTCRSTFIMDFSPDGTKVASTHGDHSVRVTEIATGQCVQTLQGHPRTPWCLAYHPSSNHILASGCLSGQVRIWDLYGPGCEVWQTENSTVIASLTFHPTDHVLVIAAGNSLYFWDWSQPEPFTKCSTAHEYERIRWVRFDRLGYDLYTGISNNNAIHRDEVARVSLSSQNQNPIPSPRHPARMTNVYSRIINRYQEYRRDRLAQETTSQAEEQGPSRQSDIESSDDMYPGVRDIDIVEPRSPSSTEHRVYRPTLQPSRTVTTNSIADHVTQLSNTASQNRRRSAVRVISDCLINPSNDPFLSPGPSQSIFVNSTDSSVIPAASEPVNVIPSTSTDSVRVDLEQDLRRVETLTTDLNAMCPGSSDNTTSSSTVNLSSALNTANMIQPLGATLGTDLSATQISDAAFTQGSISSSSVTDSSQTLSESIRTSITSCSDINPILARYLKNLGSKNNPRSVGQNTKAFPSIRDRLKSTISLPAQSSDNAGAQPKVIVGTGIPPVTILPASDSSRPITVLSGSDPTIPHVSVVFSHSSKHGTCTESLPNATVASGNQPSTTTSSDCSTSKDSTPVNTLSSHEGIRTVTASSDSCGLAVSSVSETGTVLNDTVTSSQPKGNSRSICDVFPRPIVQVTSSASSTIPSIVSPTSPFQTYIRGITDRYRRNRNNRANPYTRPSQSTSSMSIMGPYLESRGMSVPNPISSVSDMSAPTSSSGMIDSVIERALSRTQRRTQSNEEDSSSNQNSAPLTDRHRNDQPVELTVDLNENYTAVRNANTAQSEQSVNEVHVSSNDDNNNSLHIVRNANVGAVTTATGENCENPRDQVFVELRNTFVSMTDQIEREMSDLNRRINSLRDNFYTSLFSLRQDRQRYEIVGQNTDTPAVTNNSTVDNIESVRRSQSSISPVVITHNADQQDTDQDEVENNEDTHGFIIQPPTLLETSLRSHRRGRQQGHFLQRPYLESSAEPQDWRQLQRHYLHPHYSSSIFDETINRPSNAIQSAINRAIAGAFMGTGESAVANNIINQTHRIQCWDFTKCSIPDIESCDKNIIVRHCKLHNSASCDLAPNGSLLATFVPSHQGFPDDNILAVFSLLPENKGQCLYTKSFGPNAISVSISPSDKFIMVGLAAKKLSWVFTARQMVAQIYKLEEKEAGEKSTKLIKDIFHTCSTDIRTHVSGNMARWLPLVGQGLVYGTNRGHLQLVKPGVKTPVRKTESSDSQSHELPEDDQSDNVRRFILRRVPWLTHSDPHRVSASTQTLGTRQTTSTQTETEAREASL